MRVLMAPKLTHLGQAGEVLILVLLELRRKDREGRGGHSGPRQGTRPSASPSWKGLTSRNI